MANNCDDPIINQNDDCISNCEDQECCVDITKTICVKHGEENLQDIINSEVIDSGYTFNTQPIGGIGAEARNPTIERIITRIYNGLSPELYEQVTYAELTTLISTSSLLPGGLYELTDYQTLHTIPNTSERNDTNTTIPVEALILAAVSTTQLSPFAFSPSFPNDIIKYDVTGQYYANFGDEESADFTATGHKGIIYYRENTTKNITSHFDFRNWIVRRRAIDASVYNPQYTDTVTWCLDGDTQDIGTTKSKVVAYNAETLTALDTNVYDVTTNPDGYRDFRVFDDLTPETGTRMLNIYLGSGVVNILFGGKSTDVTDRELNSVYITADKRGTKKGSTVIGNISALKLNNIESSIILVSGYINCSGYGQLQESFICHHRVGYFSDFSIEGIVQNFMFITTGTANWDKSTITGVLKNSRHIRIEVLGSGLSRHDINIVDSQFLSLGIPTTTNSRSRLNINCINGASWINTLSDAGFNCLDNAKLSLIENLNITRDSSNLEVSLPAASSYNFSMLGTDDPLNIAGTFIITGSGSQQIDTVQLFPEMTSILNETFRTEKVFKPSSSLTLTFPTNNVDYGFINSSTVSANGANGEVIIIKPVGNNRWIAYN